MYIAQQKKEILRKLYAHYEKKIVKNTSNREEYSVILLKWLFIYHNLAKRTSVSERRTAWELHLGTCKNAAGSKNVQCAIFTK